MTSLIDEICEAMDYQDISWMFIADCAEIANKDPHFLTVLQAWYEEPNDVRADQYMDELKQWVRIYRFGRQVG